MLDEEHLKYRLSTWSQFSNIVFISSGWVPLNKKHDNTRRCSQQGSKKFRSPVFTQYHLQNSSGFDWNHTVHIAPPTQITLNNFKNSWTFPLDFKRRSKDTFKSSMNTYPKREWTDLWSTFQPKNMTSDWNRQNLTIHDTYPNTIRHI